MTRIQIARDIRMAHALERARLPGKTVVLLAGGGHVLRDRGVPVHLAPDVSAKVLLLQAGVRRRPRRQVDLVLPDAGACPHRLLRQLARAVCGHRRPSPVARQ
jgi:hypothetical protein